MLKPDRLSVQVLAKNHVHVPASCIDDIVLQRCGITAEMAMRLARYFGGDAKSRLGLQMMYDLHVARCTSAQARKSTEMKELAMNAATLAAWIFPVWGTTAYFAARFGLIKGVEFPTRNSAADPK